MATQSREDSARKQELLQRAYEYVLQHGLMTLSLRPLARAKSFGRETQRR